MATSSMTRIVQHLRKAALARDGGGMTDGQLLESFIAQRDESAFEVLVRRHGPMVMGVCRRTLGNVHDAEDAFQATFLVLVRKAASIVPRELVGNWLYGVAYRTALEARSKTARRHAKMKQVTDMPQPTVQLEEVWRELAPLLDQELNRLPDKYRLPLVLCQLEGRSRKEVAQQLQLLPGTLSSRLATAKQLLAGRLTHRGVAIAAGPMAVLLSQQAASASVPALLVNSTVKAAALLAAGETAAAVISPTVAALTQGVLKAMFMTKLKVAALYLLVAAGVIALGSGALMHRLLADTPSDRPAASAAPGQKSADVRQEQARDQDRPRTETVTGKLEAVDAGKNTVTISVFVTRGDPAVEKTFPVANDCTIVQDGNKVKLGDLRKDHRITLEFSADKKTVERISVTGPTVSGQLKAVDAGKNTITVSFPVGRDGATVEKTFELAERFRIVQDGKGANLGELKPDNGVVVQVSTDDKTVSSISVSGRTVGAQLKSVDAAKNTITVSLSPRDTENKTYPLATGLKVSIDRAKEVAPAELKEGTDLLLTFAAVDGKTVIKIHIQPPPGAGR